MKKFSVSMLALVAIFFAVTSAFTNSSTEKELTLKWYANPTELTTLPNPPTSPLIDVTSAVATAGGASNFASSHCTGGVNYVCFVQFDEEDDEYGETVGTDIFIGDYN